MITDTLVIDGINRRLLEEYRVLDGRPIYRIVWSADQLEMRKGKFSDWYGEHIFIREYTAVKEIKKYWYLEYPCWMLEKLIFIANQHSLKEVSEELVEARNGSYEPVYPFKNSNGPLPVDQEIVDFIIWKLHNPTSKAQYEKLEELQEKEEVGYFEEEIGKDERSPLFVFENSAWVSTNQVKFRQTYVEKSKEAPSGIVV